MTGTPTLARLHELVEGNRIREGVLPGGRPSHRHRNGELQGRPEGPLRGSDSLRPARAVELASASRSWWTGRQSGRNHDQVGEVRAVAGRVAGKQTVPGNGGVGADVEVRERRTLESSAPPVPQEALASEECCLVWQLLAPVQVVG